MYEKEEEWNRQTLAKDKRICELQARTAEHAALNKQMHELHNSLSKAHGDRERAEKELGLCIRRNQGLRFSVSNMQATLDDLQDDLASVRETSRLESPCSRGLPGVRAEVEADRKKKIGKSLKECEELREQVEELEETLSSSRKKFNTQVQSLEDEFFSLQKETEREVARRVEAQIQVAKEEYQQRFFQQREEGTEEEFDEEEYTAKVSAYLEVKIRAELTDPNS